MATSGAGDNRQASVSVSSGATLASRADALWGSLLDFFMV